MNEVARPGSEDFGGQDRRPAAAARPTFMLIGGRPAAGKSLFGLPGPAQVYSAGTQLMLSVRSITALLREREVQRDGKARYELPQADLYHTESVHLLKLGIIEARARAKDVVLELTMQHDVTGWVGPFQAAGYRVEAHYMFLPCEKAAERALQRWIEGPPRMGGPLIPIGDVLGMTENERNFQALAGRCDSWSAWSNDVPRGMAPVLIKRGERAQSAPPAVRERP
jgi:hypothetical protein